jgi:predicted GNAT family acetyltransferase
MGKVVVHEPQNTRYVILVDGERVGLTAYELRDNAIVFVHTEIDPERRERGLADQLVRSALDDVRATSARRVVAECPYVARWLRMHPDYQDLLTR